MVARDRDGKRRISFSGDGIEGRLLTLHFKMRVKILRHALHAHGADGGDAGRFYPLKHFLRRSALRAVARMQLGIVMTKAQGKFIANPAHRIDFGLACTHGRHRQA